MVYKPFTIKVTRFRDGDGSKEDDIDCHYVELKLDNGGYWCAMPDEIVTFANKLVVAAMKAANKNEQIARKEI